MDGRIAGQTPQPDFGLPFVMRELKQEVDNLGQRVDTHMVASATKAEVAFLAARIDSIVPRPEHELRWKHDDERTLRLNEKIDSLADKVDTLVAGNIPTRLDKVERTLDEMPGKIFRGVSGVVSIIAGIAGLIGWLASHLH
jgi:hypothetical protein